jgi:hypothetical protein
MLKIVYSKLSKSWFNFLANGIFNTLKIKCDNNSNVLIVTQLYPPDLTMYLLAAKSFSRFLPPYEFVIVDDKLSEQDRDILRAHFERIRFVPLNGINSDVCPKGGCWERLLTIAMQDSGYYIVQLDADTLTLSRPDEVLRCISENRSFTLGTSSGTETASLNKASQFANEHLSDHVQIQAERVLNRYPGNEKLRYVRGCAGFSGFAAGYLKKEMVEEFSSNMTQLVGENKWQEWGSEQVASNFLVANAQGAEILPISFYPFWAPSIDSKAAKLIHFVGTYRYHAGKYASLAKSVISQLK